ncbi:MAG: hypothetical protein EAY75_05495 [Bacteroidetes bacterium]|nr:MAG: hypothetical protein EAY75_05495 [Bacteroidota bacterium]
MEKRKNLRQKYTPDPPDDDEGDISETETPPTEPITPISASETPQSKAKQSKAKQSKKEEGEGALSAQEFSEEKLQVLSDEEAQELNRIVAALVKSGVPQRFIIAAYLHYAAKGWVLTEGVVIQPRNRIKTILSAWSTPRKRKAIEWKEPDVKIPPEQKSAQNQHSDNYDEELRAWSNRKSAPTVGLMSGFAPPS